VVRWLLDKGAAVNEQNELGHGAMWWASREGHPQVVVLLLERGADPTLEEEEARLPC
jgi:ankyrin repeat protein